jgi:hypothetical protein
MIAAMALEELMTDAPIPLRDYVPEADAFVQMRVDWAGYEALLSVRGEQRRPRMTYVDGVLELMTTSPTHERLRFLMGRLLERYAMKLGINLFGYSQTTYRKQLEDFGRRTSSGTRPAKTAPTSRSKSSGRTAASTSCSSTRASACPRSGSGRPASSRCSCCVAIATRRAIAASYFPRSISR